MGVEEAVRDTLEQLRAASDPVVLRDMPTRYGIHTGRAMGVRMARMKEIARGMGTDHDVALGLWDTGWYEARTVASLVDDPAAVDAAQMDAWCADFDNWAIVDTVCFNLFDRTEPAWSKVDGWAARDREFEKRAAFALLWSLALHDRGADDDRFRYGLALIESAAGDGRPLVDKAIGMALRAIGKRRPALRARTVQVAQHLEGSEGADARRIGRQALKELQETG